MPLVKAQNICPCIQIMFAFILRQSFVSTILHVFRAKSIDLIHLPLTPNVSDQLGEKHTRH